MVPTVRSTPFSLWAVLNSADQHLYQTLRPRQGKRLRLVQDVNVKLIVV